MHNQTDKAHKRITARGKKTSSPAYVRHTVLLEHDRVRLDQAVALALDDTHARLLLVVKSSECIRKRYR
jgi:hypothetical protein